MKDPFERTKVVLRHLPTAISQSALMEQIDGRFYSRYKWACFRPGKSSKKNQRHSRAYIDFKRPEDVVEFAEFFDGHIFVNEKGAQFKAVVEYAPSQRIPKMWSKKDGREGTILKDPDHLEFLERLARPVENLPSAEIQLERKEAEKAGSAKETFIVTPLMDFVRQKTAAKNGSQRSTGNGKLSRRGRVVLANSSSKRGSEKRSGPTLMYVSRDSTKNESGKDKSTYILVPRREEQQLPDKSVAVASASGTDLIEDKTVTITSGTISVVSGVVDGGKRRLLLLKGKEREGSHASGSLAQQNVTSSVRNSPGSTAIKQNQRHEASGRIIRSILSNKEGRLNLSHVGSSQPEQQMQTVNSEKGKCPPRPPLPILKDHASSSSPLASVSDSDSKRYIDDKAVSNDLHVYVSNSEKHDKCIRNKDRPDQGVWGPLRRSDGSHVSEGTLSSSSISAQVSTDSLENISVSQQAAEIRAGVDNMGFPNARVGRGSNSLAANDIPLGHVEIKHDMRSSSRSAEIKNLEGRVSLTPGENGSHRQVGRRGRVHGLKELDCSFSLAEGKSSKRGPSSYASHERQVWVQKSGSAS